MTSSSPPIRVLHIITRLIVGGAQENTMFTAALLDKSRFQVQVLAGPQTGSEGSLIEEVKAYGIPLTILPGLLRELNPVHDLIAIWKLYRIIRTGGYQIVHTHSSKAGVLGRIAARLAKVPVIVHTVHGWSFHDYMSSWLRRLYIALEKLIARFTDALIVVTRRDIEKGLKEGIGKPEQYHLIRSAIPLDQFDPDKNNRQKIRQELGLPAASPVLGNVGRFSEQKNPLDWVKVAGQVGRAMPECRFLLVGDGPLRPQVESALAKAGIADRTVLTGLRRDPGVMMSAMDVFLLTSLWEGLPRVLPQAMALRLPVVAYRADGASEAVVPGETGYLAQPGDLDELAGCCLKLLSEPELRQSVGERARQEAIREFDLRVMIEQIETLYEQFLGG